MGTNYYFIARSKELVNEHFAKKSHYCNYDEEYRVVDEPYLGYQMHLNKLSGGWKPLFEEHKEFRTFHQLKEFYNEHKKICKYIMSMEKLLLGMNILMQYISIVCKK